ncbi:copper chaperone [Noviherbaspirillum humi]|uniref:Copper chaperone n=1 Tax=Noviherbaspirillum humi TaxID=1688639 RepID=A0A239CHF0_9BURK|nr:cation transporter [Noviherbaspirillum humi]SNS19635.1 copper chaperone [Noviherbaspirillum humi]
MYEFNVQGMSCSHCVNAVTRSIQEVDSAAKVDVDLARHKVRVESSREADKIQAAIVDAGYTVSGAAH